MSCLVRTTLLCRKVFIGFVPLKSEIWTLCKTSRHYYSRPDVDPRASISPLLILGWESSRNSLIQPTACLVLHSRFLHNRNCQDISGALPNNDIQSSTHVPDATTATNKSLSDYRPEFPTEVCLRHRESAGTVVGAAPPETSRPEMVGDSQDSLAKNATKFNMVVQPKNLRKLYTPDSLVTNKNEPANQVHTIQPWQVQKQALAQKFGSSGWAPRKRLSPDALEGIRSLHSQFPEKYTTPVLASHFQISPEAIRRILKSKWRPNQEEELERRDRWTKRGESIWRRMVEIGIKPPKKWRYMGSRKRMTRTAGMAAQNEVSVREHLLGALRYRSIRKNYAATMSWNRGVVPAPLSGRIL